MKCISVLLTTYPGRFSKAIACLSGRGYTHASIGLEDPDVFYSFHFRGFAVETPEKLRRQGVTQSRCYRLLISDGALSLEKAPGLYLPNHFPRELERRPETVGVLSTPI